MKEQLNKLGLLQETDIEIDQLSDECGFIPSLIEKKKFEAAEQKKELETEKAKTKELQLKHKSLEIDLGSNEEKTKKLKMDLNSVKTNEQYKALLSEIEKAEKDKSLIEDGILEVMTEVDEFNVKIKEFEQKIKLEDGKLAGDIDRLILQKNNCEKKLADKKNERQKSASEIPEAVLKKYEHIRKNMDDGVAIAPIQGSNCGVCGMKLPAQVLNEVSKDKSLVFCENCSRILYLPNGLLKTSAGEGQKAAPRENQGEESPNSRAAENVIPAVKG